MDHTHENAPFHTNTYTFGAFSQENAAVSPPTSGLVGAMSESTASEVVTDEPITDRIASHYDTIALNLDSLPSFADRESQHSGKEFASDTIEFRVTNSGSPSRRLRLTGNRYTFGSAHGCSIQLSDKSLRPMHAVLIRDASRILVRAYSVPIEVNFQRTTEATLNVGDVMRLGNYHFELLGGSTWNRNDWQTALNATPAIGTAFSAVQSPAASLVAEEPLRTDTNQPPWNMSPPSSSEENRSQNQYTMPKMSAAENRAQQDNHWREQLRREVDAWRRRQEELERRESRFADRESELRTRETELWSRAEILNQRETRLFSEQASVRELQSEYHQKRTEAEQLCRENETRLRSFEERETEFRKAEAQYRQQMEDAEKQLFQSQSQAKAATEAISQMQQQFTGLKEQIQTLVNSQKNSQAQQQQSREEQDRIRIAIEQQRDTAVDAKNNSDAARVQALTRLDELTHELEELRQIRASEQRLVSESETVAKLLRTQIEQLQQSLQQASEETATIKGSYDEACHAVERMESMIREGELNHQADHESWLSEAAQLHQSVEDLSIQLANANRELAELGEANAGLAEQLNQLQKQRDDAITEIQLRPTNESLEAISSELNSATLQLSLIKSQYEEKIADLQWQVEEKSRQVELAAEQAAEQATVHAAEQAALLAGNQDGPQISDKHAGSENNERSDHHDEQASLSEASLEDELEDEVHREASSQLSHWETPSVLLEEQSETADNRSDSESMSWQTPSGLRDEADEADEDDRLDACPESDDERRGETSAADEHWPETPCCDDPPESPWTQSSVEWAEAEEPSDSADFADDDDAINISSKIDLSVAGPPDAHQDERSEHDEHVEPGSFADQLIRDLQSEQSQCEQHVADDDAEHLSANPSAEHTSEWSFEDAADQLENRIDSLLEQEEHEDATALFSSTGNLNLPTQQEPSVSPSCKPSTVEDQQGAAVKQEAPKQQGVIPDEEDDSIEAYMNRLLRRVQGESGTRSVASVLDHDSKPETKIDIQTLASPEEPSVTQDAEPESPLEYLDPSEPLVPRSQAPEKSSNLSAMRDLANQSARTAISRSVKVQTRDIQIKGATKFLTAGVSAICAIAIAVLVSHWVKYVAVICLFILAAFCIQEGLVLMSDAVRRIRVAEANKEAEQDDQLLNEELRD